MDWLAIVSSGAYPTPTPTAAARAAFAVSYGLLNIGAGSLPTAAEITGRGLGRLGMDLTTT